MSPQRALRMCLHPGCRVIVPGGRCAKHEGQRQKAELERRREYETRRPPRSLPTWDREWRSLRAGYLKRHPTCSCGAPATEVHHRVPVEQDPSLRLEWANLQALCKTCHARLEAATPGHWAGRKP